MTLLLAHIGGVPVEELLTGFPLSVGAAAVMVLATMLGRLRSRRR